jgi:hypothetical protein
MYETNKDLETGHKAQVQAVHTSGNAVSHDLTVHRKSGVIENELRRPSILKTGQSTSASRQPDLCTEMSAS